MKPSFFKNLGPISLKSISEQIEITTTNLKSDDKFTELVRIDRLNENSLSFLYDNMINKNRAYNDGTFICSNKVFQNYKEMLCIKIINYKIL